MFLEDISERTQEVGLSNPNLGQVQYIYHPQTKLWEGNIFTGVSHSVYGVSPCDDYPWCIGTWVPPGYQTWDLPPCPCPPFCYRHLMVITGDLFKPVHSRTFPPWSWHLVVAIKTHTVGKQTVRILLECCLVISIVKPWIFEYLLCLIYVIRHAQKVSYNNN